MAAVLAHAPAALLVGQAMTAIAAAAMRCKTMADLVGLRFGALVVKSYYGVLSNRKSWFCECDCGVSCVKPGSHLVAGNIQSCGCKQFDGMRAARLKNGARRSDDAELRKFYAAWGGMKARCSNPKHKDYRYYGERGISVCDRWAEFENFKADMWPRPDRKTLDRIDPDLGYSPENCRWATHQEQRLNQRRAMK
jgi:hypothetical protein